ncbi:MAG: hydrogenase formation protein HypD [Candidatus Omnitrophota bacterium]
MKYVDEFRNKKLAARLSAEIKTICVKEQLNFMEVCGTHTQSFYRFGIDKLLPENINLIAGPGCPVCVSSQDYIDKAIKIAKTSGVLLSTFGDMLRIPGTESSLEKERAEGADIRVVYSAYQSLELAEKNPDKRIVFLGVGFETTAPTIALSIIAAKKKSLKNISYFCALKLIPAAMEELLKDKRLNLDGFLCPGHVSSIIGTQPYEAISRKYRIPCCIAGFEPLDILEGIYFLVRQVKDNKPRVVNQYSRVVKEKGNIEAKKIMQTVFKLDDAIWRGLGKINASGLKIKAGFADFDAEKVFNIKPDRQRIISNKQCRCADILKGLIIPEECSLFLQGCSPENPVGPCMVSSEGACNAYYKYK